jgi:hypothetical protein
MARIGAVRRGAFLPWFMTNQARRQSVAASSSPPHQQHHLAGVWVLAIATSAGTGGSVPLAAASRSRTTALERPRAARPRSRAARSRPFAQPEGARRPISMQSRLRSQILSVPRLVAVFFKTEPRHPPIQPRGKRSIPARIHWQVFCRRSTPRRLLWQTEALAQHAFWANDACSGQAWRGGARE